MTACSISTANPMKSWPRFCSSRCTIGAARTGNCAAAARGSFDFPVLSVAAAVRFSANGVIEDARIVIGSVASRPLVADEAARFLVRRSLTAESIAEAAALAARVAKPLDNTDFDMSWRKKVTAEFVTYALRELRGDDVTAERAAITRIPSA